MLALWFAAFLLTVCVEMPVAVLLLKELRWRRVAAVAFVASAITHPTLWLVWFAVLIDYVPYTTYVIGGEIMVALVETVVLRTGLELTWSRALGVAITMNLASYVMGELVR